MVTGLHVPTLSRGEGLFSRHVCSYANAKEQTPFSVFHMDHRQPLYCSMGVSLTYCGTTRLELRKRDCGSSCCCWKHSTSPFWLHALTWLTMFSRKVCDEIYKHQGGLLSDAERCLFFNCISRWNRSNACLNEVALKGGCFLRNVTLVIIHF